MADKKVLKVELEDGSFVEPYTLQGYYDDVGNYIPGYYDDAGVYHYGYGYYDDQGEWIVAHGFYDPQGEWIPTIPKNGGNDDLKSDTEVYTQRFFRADKPGSILEVAYLWSDRVLDVQNYKKPRTILVGGDQANDYVLDNTVFDTPRFKLVSYDEDRGYWLNFTPQMTGTIQVAGQRLSLEQAIARGMASPSEEAENAYTLPLTRAMSVRLDFGRNTFLLHFTSCPAYAGGAFAVERAPLTFLAVSFALHLAFMLAILMLPADYGGLELRDFNAHDRFVDLATTPEDEEEPEEEIPEWLEEESLTERTSATDADKEVEAADDVDELSETDLAEDRDREVAEQHGVFAALDNSLLSTDCCQDLYGDLVALEGEHLPGGHHGVFEGSARPDGFGQGENIGQVGTEIPGDGGDRAPNIDIGHQPTSEPGPILGQPETTGALDREIIQRVVRQHRREIRNCYERELQRNPDLQGRVIMQFVISGSGDVVSARVEESTMDNHEVGRCMTRRIRRWSFPEPDGGGIVRVNYPFNFSS